MCSGGVVFRTLDSSGMSSGTARKYKHMILHYTCLSNMLCVTDTCDPGWQSTRDALIIAAHVISDLAFLVEVVTAGLVCIAICCRDYCEFFYNWRSERSHCQVIIIEIFDR